MQEDINNEHPHSTIEKNKKVKNENTSKTPMSLKEAKAIWCNLTNENFVLINQCILNMLFTVIFINKKVYTNGKLDYTKCKRSLTYFMNVNKIEYQRKCYKQLDPLYQKYIKSDIFTPYQLNKNKWILMRFDQLQLCVMQGNPRVYLMLQCEES